MEDNNKYNRDIIYRLEKDIEKLNTILFGIGGKHGAFDDINCIKRDIRYIYIMLITIVVILAGMFGEHFVSLLK